MPLNANCALPLAQAIDLEDDLIHRFRRWTLRFLPFDQTLVSLFGRLVTELEGHRYELLLHAGQHRQRTPGLKPAAARHKPERAEHFFILSMAQAITAVGEALARMREAARFYRLSAVLTPWDSLLAGIYQNLGACMEPCIEMLQERLNRLRLQRLELAHVTLRGTAPIWRH